MPLLRLIWEYKIWAFFISLVALATATPQLITAWDVLCYRFRDYAVLECLEAQQTESTGYGGRIYFPRSAKDIADELGRSEKSVLCSLKRMKKGRMGEHLVQADNGWYSTRNARPN